MAEHTVAAFLVHQILQGAQRQGHDIDAILRRAGIAPATVAERQARVPQSQYAALMRTLRRVMRDEFWGLADRPLAPGTFALLCARLIHCADLGHALQTGFAFMRLFMGDPAGRLSVNGDAATIRVRHKRAPADGEYDFCVATFLYETMQLASWLVGREIPISEVRFHFQAPVHRIDSERLLVGKRRYNAGQSELIFDAGALRLPLVQDTAGLEQFLAQTPGNLVLRFRRHGGLVEQLTAQLRSYSGGEMPDVQACAAQLGWSAQTLRRRLRAEGVGYQGLVNKVRRDYAIQLLQRRELALDAVATMLGFSESSTFHRAFKKWTGMSPGMYRRRHGMT